MKRCPDCKELELEVDTKNLGNEKVRVEFCHNCGYKDNKTLR